MKYNLKPVNLNEKSPTNRGQGRFVTFKMLPDTAETLSKITKKLRRSKAFIAEQALTQYINNIIENGYTESCSFKPIKVLPIPDKD